MTVNDKQEQDQPAVKITVERLIKEAHKHQSFVKKKRWPDWGLNPGPSRHIPDALTTELSGLYQQIN